MGLNVNVLLCSETSVETILPIFFDTSRDNTLSVQHGQCKQFKEWICHWDAFSLKSDDSGLLTLSGEAELCLFLKDEKLLAKQLSFSAYISVL